MLSNLITTLEQRQRHLDLNDSQMAHRLGCSRQLYQMTRTGKIPPGPRVLKGISGAFPELQQDIIYFLSSNADELSKGGDTIPLKEPSGAQERGLKRFCRGLLGRVRDVLK